MNESSMKMLTALVGLIVAGVFITICLILGTPSTLDPAKASWQFGLALGLSGALILSPFLFAILGRGDSPRMPVSAGVLAVMGLGALVSAIATLLLYGGLGYTTFLILHLILLAILTLAALGFLGMGRIAGQMGQRQALAGNRRQQILAVVQDIELGLAGAPPEAARVISQLQEELRLLTPMQMDRNPQLMTRLWAVVEDLRKACTGLEGKSWSDALTAAQAAITLLKRA